MTTDPFYLHTDIPPEMTIAEYRRSHLRHPRAARRATPLGFGMRGRKSRGPKKATGSSRLRAVSRRAEILS